MKEQTFEEKMEELEQLVKQLESGDLTLDQSVNLYQKGITLAKDCHKELKEAEKTIVSLKTDSGLEDFTE